jgi:hypothetical protein
LKACQIRLLKPRDWGTFQATIPTFNHSNSNLRKDAWDTAIPLKNMIVERSMWGKEKWRGENKHAFGRKIHD